MIFIGTPKRVISDLQHFDFLFLNVRPFHAQKILYLNVRIPAMTEFHVNLAIYCLCNHTCMISHHIDFFRQSCQHTLYRSSLGSLVKEARYSSFNDSSSMKDLSSDPGNRTSDAFPKSNIDLKESIHRRSYFTTYTVFAVCR